jgi:outer membrane usher protein
MKRLPRKARRGAQAPFSAMKPSYAMVLLAYSSVPMAATQDDQASGVEPRETKQPMSIAQVQFDPSFIMTTPDRAVDLSRFERGNPILPGEYRPDIYLNGTLIGRETVEVRGDEKQAYVCITRPLLEKLNVDFNQLNKDILAELAEPDACIELQRAVPGASLTLDTSEQRLEVSIPQIAQRRTARGSVDPQLWDSGVTAGILGYNGNVYRNVGQGQTSNSAYLGINSGVNVASWVFRHNGALTWTEGGERHYSVANTYLQRDITPLKARLTLGDANTSGDVFDTFAFRGAQIATDDRMWPESLRGYAPVVRGIAESNARVTIRQNGAVIYDTPVPPGQFVIDDLYPTGYGGDLNVTVTEADGRERKFVVPYASVPQLLRPGMTRFAVTAGTVRNVNLSYTPRVVQAIAQRGLTNTVTLYGGVLANDNYASVTGGGALSTPIGAFAVDVSGARTSGYGQSRAGTSIRATYSKLYTPTDSNISVAAYRFSSRGYLDFNNALIYIDNARRGVTGSNALPYWQTRNRVTVTASQGFGDKWGQVYLSGQTQNYWDRGGSDTQFQFGYSNSFRNIDYSLTVGRSFVVGTGQTDTQYMATVSLPLGRDVRAPRMNFNMIRDSSGGTSGQAVISGLAGSDNQASYSAGVSRQTNNTYAGNVSGQYHSPYTTMLGAFGKGSGYASGSLGLNGSVVVHPGGVTARPYAADTVAIVAAPDAGGAKIASYGGIRLDPRGYGVVPYLMPYRVNEISIDPKDLPADVELQTTSQQVVPRSGAVVMLRYRTVTGRAVLIKSRLPNGDPLPFGAPVFDSKGQNVGTVAQGGQVYARVNGSEEKLTVKWGHSDAWACSIFVKLPEKKQDKKSNALTFDRLEAPCEVSASPPQATRRSPAYGKPAS